MTIFTDSRRGDKKALQYSLDMYRVLSELPFEDKLFREIFNNEIQFLIGKIETLLGEQHERT